MLAVALAYITGTGTFTARVVIPPVLITAVIVGLHGLLDPAGGLLAWMDDNLGK